MTLLVEIGTIISFNGTGNDIVATYNGAETILCSGILGYYQIYRVNDSWESLSLTVSGDLVLTVEWEVVSPTPIPV